jgi:Lipid A 3-O-deacylase (PagL)
MSLTRSDRCNQELKIMVHRIVLALWFRCWRLSVLGLGVLWALPPVTAYADGIVSEVSVGVLDHDVRALGGKEHGIDMNGEIQFVSPVGLQMVAGLPVWLRWLFRPYPTLGFDINSSGYTNQYYAGGTWTAELFTDVLQSDDGVFVSLGGGGAVNNGHVGPTTEIDRKKLGSNVLFHLTGELGYRFSRRDRLAFFYEHSSNAGLAHYNQSLNDAGLRFAWRF